VISEAVSWPSSTRRRLRPLRNGLLSRIAEELRPAHERRRDRAVEEQEPELRNHVTDKPWIVIVWNDPVNLMNYVVYVFQKLFGYFRARRRRS
jgi:hypothetical protein